MVDRDDQAANTAMFRAYAQRRDAEDTTAKPVVTPLRLLVLLAALAAVALVVGLLLA